jgi:hypothetical protein
MPTGYTAAVQDGKITTFREFALQCARAFGACIEMRDDPSDAPIPDEFPARTDYHDRELERARRTLAELEGIGRDQCALAAAAAHKDALASWEASKARRELENGRYEAMRQKVLAWTPPSDEHVEMKNFMLQQLDISMDRYTYEKPKLQTPAAWLGEQVRQAQHSIEYHTKGREDEIARAEQRNRWLRLLRESLVCTGDSNG